MGRAFHFFFQHRRERRDFRLDRLQHQFVVDLEEDAALEISFAEPARHCDHREFHDVRRRALDGRIHRHALGEGTAQEIFASDVGELAHAAEKCHRMSRFPRFLHRFLHKVLDARIALEIRRDIIRRRFFGNTELARKAEIADAVDDAEIHRFGVRALLRRDVFGRDAQDFRRRPPMNVLAPPKRFLHRVIARHVRHHAQLHLRIIRREETVVAVPRHEERTNFPALFRPDRDVLQIRRRAREPPRRRRRLVETRVNAPRFRPYQLRKCLEIRRDELRERAII